MNSHSKMFWLQMQFLKIKYEWISFFFSKIYFISKSNRKIKKSRKVWILLFQYSNYICKRGSRKYCSDISLIFLETLNNSDSFQELLTEKNCVGKISTLKSLLHFYRTSLICTISQPFILLRRYVDDNTE